MRAAENPFRVTCIEALPFVFRTGGWDELFARLQAQYFRGEIVGPCGAGKTTLLLELRGRLTALGLVTHLQMLSADAPRCSPAQWRALGNAANAGAILMLDGAEQLDPFAWVRLRHAARKAAGLVITSHVPGRLPPLYHCTPSEHLLETLLHRLLNTETSSWHAAARSLYATTGGNIRGVFLGLYDQAAARS